MFCHKCAASNGWKPTWNTTYGHCTECGVRSHCTTDDKEFISVVKEVKQPSTMAENIMAITKWMDR